MVRNRTEEVIVIPFSEELGYLEQVIVHVSTSFQNVDTDNYLENNVYDYLYQDFVNDTGIFENYVFPNRGDIQMELTSPQGTTSILLPYRTPDSWPGEYNKWPFMSVHFWGENPSGDWTITVRNRGNNGTVILSDVELIFYGTTSTPAVISRIPAQCDSACARGCAATGAMFCDACRQSRNAKTLECVEDCAEGQTRRSGYCYDASKPEPECVRQELPTESDGGSGAMKLSSFNFLLVTIIIMIGATE